MRKCHVASCDYTGFLLPEAFFIARDFHALTLQLQFIFRARKTRKLRFFSPQTASNSSLLESMEAMNN